MAVVARIAAGKVEQLSDATDDTLAAVVHDLRSPFVDIVLAAQHLAEGFAGGVSDEQRRLLELIVHNAKRGLALTSELNPVRTFPGTPAAVPGIQGETHDLALLAGGYVAGARLRAEARGLTLVSEADPDAYACYDPIRIERVLDNLVSNSLKFTPPGGRIVVSVDARRSELVTLSVSDTGIGIAKAEQHLVGRRWFRGLTAARQGIPGSGLGLSIAQAIVAEHGGRLTVDSDEGVGTTIRVELPRRRRPHTQS